MTTPLTMKAASYHRYGSPQVVTITDVPRPSPGPHDVLVRILSATVSSADVRVRSLQVPAGFGLLVRPMFGLFGPRQPILGTEFAGVVDAIGSAVTLHRVGDRVFGFPGVAMGSHAEFRVMHEEKVAKMPNDASFDEASALSFGGTTALYFLRDRAQLQAGERVLIIGAAGTVGSAAVQLAKHLGAHVTAVTNAKHIDVITSIGADVAMDRHSDHWQQQGRYDVIFDAVGATDFSSCRRWLAPRGRLCLIAATLYQMLGSVWTSATTSHRVLVGGAPERIEDLRLLAELFGTGAYRPLIDEVFPLARIADAHARVDGGHKRGSVVVRMAG